MHETYVNENLLLFLGKSAAKTFRYFKFILHFAICIFSYANDTEIIILLLAEYRLWLS